MTFEERQNDITETAAELPASPLPLSTEATGSTTSVAALPHQPAAGVEIVDIEAADEPSADFEDADEQILAEMSDEDRAKALASQKAKRLGKMAEKIRKARSAITAKMLQIAELLQGAKEELEQRDDAKDLAKSRARMRAFAHVEGGIPRGEINTYQRLASLQPEERALLTQQGTGFDVLKAIATDPGLREDVIDRMRATIRMDIAAVRRVRYQRKLAAETPLVRLLRLQPARNSMTSRKELAAALRTFEADTGALARKLVSLSAAVDILDEEYQARCNTLSTLASELLHRLDTMVDTDDSPDDWMELQYAEPDLHGVAEALLTLRQIAYGGPDVPEEWYALGYIETDETDVDRLFIDPIARLAGIRPGELAQDSKAKSLRRRVPVLPKLPRLSAPPKPLISIELCAGAGGQALGLHSAGFHARATFEREKDAAATLRQHFRHAVNRVFSEDITDVDFGVYRGSVDLVAGGIPCQPYSTAGERKGEDDERDLFRRAVEIVDEVQPRAFFFENVQGFGHTTNMAYRAELHAAFEAIGYESRIFPILGSDYGLAQGRPRIAFIGFRDHDVMHRFRMPPIFPQWQLTLADAIGDLVSANGWKGYEDWRKIANTTAPTIVGGSRKSDKHSFSSGLTREAWELRGIDSRSLAKAAPEPDHVGLFKLTLEMGARLQGFPDDWRFQGTDKQIKSQIGNALPPVMARAVGLAIYAALENVDFDYAQVLKTLLHTPVPPAPLARTSARLVPPPVTRRYRQAMAEHHFFGEVIEDLDDKGEVIETVISPDSYRLISKGD